MTASPYIIAVVCSPSLSGHTAEGHIRARTRMSASTSSDKEPTMDTSKFYYELHQQLPATLTGAEREALRLLMRVLARFSALFKRSSGARRV